MGNVFSSLPSYTSDSAIFCSIYRYPVFQADASCISSIYSYCSANSPSILQPQVLSMCLTYGQFCRNHNVEFSPEECSSTPLYFCAWSKLAAVMYCAYGGVPSGRKDSDDFIGNIKLHWAFSLWAASNHPFPETFGCIPLIILLHIMLDKRGLA